MGRLILQSFYRLELSKEDVEKRRKRNKLKQDYEISGRALPYMERFAERLLPCPECGETPEISIVRQIDDDADVSIKLSCRKLHPSKIYIECGDWHETLAKAGRSWNARARGNTERIDGKLHGIGHFKRNQSREAQK